MLLIKELKRLKKQKKELNKITAQQSETIKDLSKSMITIIEENKSKREEIKTQIITEEILKKFWKEIEFQIKEKNDVKKENSFLKKLVPKETLEKAKKSKKRKKRGSILGFFSKRKSEKNAVNELGSDKEIDLGETELAGMRETIRVFYKESYREDLPFEFFSRDF